MWPPEWESGRKEGGEAKKVKRHFGFKLVSMMLYCSFIVMNEKADNNGETEYKYIAIIKLSNVL